MMQPVSGPECPSCGCQQSEVMDMFSRWSKQHERRECANCGHVFSTRSEFQNEDHSAGYPVLYCRACKIGRMKVASTNYGARSMKCDNCGRTTKVAERRLEL